MVVNPSVPAKTVPEFIAYAKANPGKVNMGSAGNGTRNSSRRRAVQDDGWRQLVHVPYRGDGPALTDLLGGQVQVHVRLLLPRRSSTSEPASCARLAVTTAMRSEVLPDIPTVGEFVPGLRGKPHGSASARHRNTPAEIIDKLNTEINAGLADPKMKARLADLAACADANDADRLRETHRRRNREVGQGDPGGQHQAGIIRPDIP